MELTGDMGDEAALEELGERLKQYRLNQNLSQADLGKLAGVSRNTITRMEAGESVQATSLIRTLRALGLMQNLDALVPEPNVSPLQLASRHGKARRRAGTRNVKAVTEGRARAGGNSTANSEGGRKPWEWNDEA